MSDSIHRDVTPLILVRYPQARVEQCSLEGEAAADQERNQIPPPVIPDIRRLIHQLALLVDPILRDIRSQVSAGRHNRRGGRAYVGYLKDRAGLRVADAELQEIEGVVFRQHYQVRLDVAGGKAAGGAVVFGVPNFPSHLFEFSHRTQYYCRSEG